LKTHCLCGIHGACKAFTPINIPFYKNIVVELANALKNEDCLLKFTIGYDILGMEVTVLQGGSLPILFLFGTFLVALLAYIDSRNNMRK